MAERARSHHHTFREQFDAVAFEIAATLNFLGVPAAEHKEFMELIESYRSQVVQA